MQYISKILTSIAVGFPEAEKQNHYINILWFEGLSILVVRALLFIRFSAIINYSSLNIQIHPEPTIFNKILAGLVVAGFAYFAVDRGYIWSYRLKEKSFSIKTIRVFLFLLKVVSAFYLAVSHLSVFFIDLSKFINSPYALLIILLYLFFVLLEGFPIIGEYIIRKRIIYDEIINGNTFKSNKTQRNDLSLNKLASTNIDSIRKIKSKIGSGKIKKSLDLALEYLSERNEEEFYNSLIIQRMRYTEIESQKRNGTISNEDFTILRNNIANSILEVIDDVEKK